jgi:invasion protein IalB
MNTSALFRTFVALLAATAFCTVASAQQKKAASPADKKAASPADKKAASPTDQAVLLGQFGEWGAYKALPGGKKICFALSKPTSSTTEPAGRSRDPAYAFVSTRPSEKVKNEVSIIVGYPQKPAQDAAAAVGTASYAMYTQNDGAWVKNAAEEAQMVETMRKGADLVVKSESARGTKTTDTFSLKGIAQALDKVAEECR